MKKRLLMCAVLGAALLCAVPRARAAGTPAGTSIGNQAYADYKDANGNAMSRVFSNTVTTLVSQVAALEFVPMTSSNSGGVDAYTNVLLQMFNRGNGSDVFTFSYATLAGATFTPDAVEFYRNGTGEHHVLELPGDVLLTAAGGVYTGPTTVADDDADIYMRVKVPAGAANGNTCSIAVTARSSFDNTVVSVGTFTVTVSAAVLSATINMSPATLAPGATGTYTITLSNTGSADATAFTLTDLLPTWLSYVPGTMLVGGVLKTDAQDGDGATYYASPSSVTFNIATIAAGTSGLELKYNVVLNTGTPANTAIPNQANFTFISGGSASAGTSSGGTFFSEQRSSATLTFSGSGTTANPGDQVVYPITVTNSGNADDRINLSYGSSAGFTWVFWVDNNNDGIPGNDGDRLLTDTNADGKVDTGTLGQNESLAVLAVASVPAGTADRTADTVTITAASSNDATKTAVKAITTTVTAPTMQISKTVSPAGAQRPGTELTYTVTATNAGTGVAKTVILSDIVPTYTTYKAASILVGGTVGTLAAKTDASDGDGAEYDSASRTVLVGSGSNLTLGPTGTLVLRFTVTID